MEKESQEWTRAASHCNPCRRRSGVSRRGAGGTGRDIRITGDRRRWGWRKFYDMETLVAAHRTLAVQYGVRVTNLTNSKNGGGCGSSIAGRLWEAFGLSISHTRRHRRSPYDQVVRGSRCAWRLPSGAAESGAGVIWEYRWEAWYFASMPTGVQQDMQTKKGLAKVVTRPGTLRRRGEWWWGKKIVRRMREILAVAPCSAEKLPDACSL